MLSIQTNVASLIAQQNLNVNTAFQTKTIEQVTSGYRINSSGDDAAGLAVANQYRSSVAELSQGVRNANDGVSTLQIVDGGLNNISTMLDRMKTLATQSASSTFTGNRSTLNNEFNSLLAEVTRQASNIGMSGTIGTNATNIAVYIGGGGATQANSMVNVNLTGSVVDAIGLGLSGSSLAAGGTAIGTINTNTTNTNGYFLTSTAANGEQDFTVNTASATYTVKVKATTNTGITINDALGQINTQLSGSGVSAAIDSNGVLNFSSSGAFSVTSGALAGTGTAMAIATVAQTVDNKGMYRMDATTSGKATAVTFTDPTGNAEGLTFTGNGQQISISLDGSQGTTAAAVKTYLNQQLASLGITAVVNNGNIAFESANSFSVAKTTANAGIFGAATFTTVAADAPVVGASQTSNALAALTQITNAITALGTVQGKVGAGQNTLTYATQLANSQISSFSAAESQIRDSDMAAEAANLTKAQVLQQASLAAMAQANAAPQAVLSLLKG